MRKFLLALAVLLLGIGHASAQSVNVVTHLYDNNNSGWQQNETVLTTANAGSISIKQTLTVDGQVDAQPLIYNGVMYVVTENDTVYAFNATTGALITSRNVGTPVPSSVSGCTNNDVVIGITSTPVIDPSTNILYFVAYLYPSSTPTYKIFAVNTADLTDAIAPATISIGPISLADSTTYSFNATVSKQRPALKLNGNAIYVGFGSFCDFATSTTRGWVLSVNKSTLALNTSSRYLTNNVHPYAANYYLTSVWQSGTGPAIDSNGHVYVATGNTGNSLGGSYAQTGNLAESVLKFNSDLTLNDYFTVNQENAYDASDNDLGATGVLLLPTLSGAFPHVGVLGGKTVSYRFINLDNLGHFVSTGAPEPTISNYIEGLVGGGDWGNIPAYIGPDGVLRVLIPAGQSQINMIDVFTNPVFKIGFDQNVAPSSSIGVIPPGGFSSGQQSGIFTTVSCNVAPRTGACYSGTALIWLITHPTGGSTNTLTPALIALDGVTGQQLGSRIPLANWPNVNGQSNLVPVVANGHVYACSYKACYIIGP